MDIADSASLVLVESPGIRPRRHGRDRAAGRAVRPLARAPRRAGSFSPRSLRLDGAIAEQLAAPAVAAGGAAVATLLAMPCDEAKLAAVRECTAWHGEAAISGWNGLAVGRFVAKDGAPLRRDVVTMLGALGVSLPRSWLN